jgi:catechol 2,3-dioxygenase-like lactoylglutathione lyase family enzyme
MPARALDHLAITVADVDATLGFYRRALDADVLHEDLYRAGRIPVVLLQVGDSRISVHSAASPALPHARRPSPGSADFCFRWDGPIDEARRHLERCGIPIEEGPVPRPAADGTPGLSVYFRDPDGNLLELLSTDGE